jgi:diguanylate cyclase (GGDEF)-like protein
MGDLRITLASAMLLEGAIALAIAALVWVFARNYSKTYPLPWSASWFALAVYYVLGAAAVSGVAPRPAWEVAAAVGGAVLAALHAGWLLTGTYEVGWQRPMRGRQRRILFGSGIGLAVALPLAAVVVGSPALGVELQGHVSSLLAGVAAALSAWIVWRRRARAGGPGFTFFAGGLLVYGAVRLGATLFAETGEAAAFYAAAAGSVAQLVLGLSMVILLLEDEREAAVLAASEIEHLAYHDSLTGLPNRSLFFDRLVLALAQARREEVRVAILFLDLDRFKEINDSLGHTVGDSLLRAVARRIRTSIREGDTLARFGGDEFTFLIQKVPDQDAVMVIAQKILETFRSPFLIGGREITITTSIGISVYPDDGFDAETLVRNADSAMYRAKEEGRDNYQFYTASMSATAIEKLEIETSLRRALVQQEFRTHYQPLIELASGRVVGFEALIRWQHPEHGLLWPEYFLPAAERSGLIVQIGEWILREACRQAKAWNLMDAGGRFVAVNLSARQFQQPDLARRVEQILLETGMEPQSLHLEITESAAMLDVDETVRILDELKSLGVQIAIDDFGTGYSSLGYLQRFPVDTIKIDQTFVHDMHDAGDSAIVNAVITMAHQMGVKVIAEGVETAVQLGILKENRCDRSQGYLFSVPLPADEFERYLLDEKRETVGS